MTVNCLFFRRVFEKVTVEVQDFVKAVAILVAAHYIVMAYSKKSLFYTEIPV